MPKKVKDIKPKPKPKQKQKQKQSIVININSHNKKHPSNKSAPSSKPSGPNIPNTPAPQYITRGMPPTINNNPVATPTQDLTKILSSMAQMSANFSGIGTLTSALQGVNERQSALESRLTEQYDMQNDVNVQNSHFNNEARDFFNSNSLHIPPTNYHFKAYTAPSTPLISENQKLYESSIIAPVPIASELQIETPVVNSDAGDVIAHLPFQPQTSIMPYRKVYTPSVAEAAANIKSKEDARLAERAVWSKSQEAKKLITTAPEEAIQPHKPSETQLAHEHKQTQKLIQGQAVVNASKYSGYNSVDEIKADKEAFIKGMVTYSPQKLGSGELWKIYNKLMKVAENGKVRSDAGNIKSDTALNNIMTNKNLNDIITLNDRVVIKAADIEQKVPYVQPGRGSMLELTAANNASSVAAPVFT